MNARPTPWRLVAPPDRLAVVVDAEGRAVASLHGAGNPHGPLLAAAPELLEALRNAAEEIAAEKCSHPGRCSAENPSCYAGEYLGFIAKAEA